MKVCKGLMPWKELFEKEISALQRKLGYFEPPEVRLLTKKEYAAHIEARIDIPFQKIRRKKIPTTYRKRILEEVNWTYDFSNVHYDNLFDYLRNIVLLCKDTFASPPKDDDRIRIFNHECVHSFVFQRAEEVAFPLGLTLPISDQTMLRINIDQKNILKLYLIHEGIATYVSNQPAVDFMYLKTETHYLTEHIGLQMPSEVYTVGCWYVKQEDQKLKQQGMKHLGERMLTIARNVPPTLESLVEKAASYI